MAGKNAAGKNKWEIAPSKATPSKMSSAAMKRSTLMMGEELSKKYNKSSFGSTTRTPDYYKGNLSSGKITKKGR